MKKVGFGQELKSRVSGIFGFYIGDLKLAMGRVRKKSGSGGYGNSRNLKCRVRVCRVLKKVGFGREFSGSENSGPITTDYPSVAFL